MKVSLVSVTEPNATLVSQGIVTPEDLIVYAARVSSPNNQFGEGRDRLLKYLIRHKHWSPFEMVDATLEIETGRDIAAQILRHRSFSFQEMSQRYQDVSFLGFEPREARSQDHKNRQASHDDLPPEIQWWFTDANNRVRGLASTLYDEAIKKGIAKECARSLLPLSTTTRLYMKGSIRSWIHYLQVRLDPSTQKEHREVAQAAFDVLSDLCPTVFTVAFPSDSNVSELKA